MKVCIVRTLTFALVIGAAVLAARAQQRELAGIPTVRNYDVENDFGGNQVWTLLRDRNGLLYVGMTGNIGQYDGSTPRVIPIPALLTRKLAMDSQGKIWVGLRADFGYLGPDATGTLKYVSLIDKIAPEDRDFLDVWRIALTPNGTFFQAYEKIFRWDGTSMKVWPSHGHNFWTITEIGGHIYAAQAGVGLEEIVGEDLRPLPGGDALAQAQRVNLLPWDAAHILVMARGEPLRLYDGHTVSPFPNEVDDYLKRTSAMPPSRLRTAASASRPFGPGRSSSITTAGCAASSEKNRDWRKRESIPRLKTGMALCGWGKHSPSRALPSTRRCRF